MVHDLSICLTLDIMPNQIKAHLYTAHHAAVMSTWTGEALCSSDCDLESSSGHWQQNTRNPFSVLHLAGFDLLTFGCVFSVSEEDHCKVSFSADLRSSSQRHTCLLGVGSALCPTFWKTDREQDIPQPPSLRVGRTHFILGIFYFPFTDPFLTGSPAGTALICASVLLSSCRITI